MRKAFSQTFNKMNVVRSSLLVGSLALGIAAQPALAANEKLGTVDMQQALQSVEAGKKAKAALEKEFNQKKSQLQKEEAAIRKMGEELRKQAAVMNDEARAKKQAELQERIMKFQEMTARSQAEIQERERTLTEPIINKLRGIIKGLATKKGYTMVLEKNENTVLFSQDSNDLTQEVIATYNKQHG